MRKRHKKKGIPNPVKTEDKLVIFGANTDVYRMGKCTIFVSDEEPTGWHLSISHPDRYPTWDEIHHARYSLTPGNIYMAMILPPKEEYVNLHKNCFHLHEIPAEVIHGREKTVS